jgi:hypothetical protein
MSMDVVKVLLSEDEVVGNFIEQNYFGENNEFKGKLNNDYTISIDKDNFMHSIIKGHGTSALKVGNSMIDGYMTVRSVVDGDDITLYPQSQYCVITVNDKYTFY